jgi:hypothetical protein
VFSRPTLMSSCPSQTALQLMLYAIHFSLSRCAISLNLHKLSDYITTLLTRAREISIEVYLQATAATFREAWRLVDAIIKVAAERNECMVTRARAEDVVYVVLSVPPPRCFCLSHYHASAYCPTGIECSRSIWMSILMKKLNPSNMLSTLFAGSGRRRYSSLSDS